MGLFPDSSWNSLFDDTLIAYVIKPIWKPIKNRKSFKKRDTFTLYLQNCNVILHDTLSKVAYVVSKVPSNLRSVYFPFLIHNNNNSHIKFEVGVNVKHFNKLTYFYKNTIIYLLLKKYIILNLLRKQFVNFIGNVYQCWFIAVDDYNQLPVVGTLLHYPIIICRFNHHLAVLVRVGFIEELCNCVRNIERYFRMLVKSPSVLLGQVVDEQVSRSLKL